jgi:prenyltransferase beta subunit
MSNRDWLNKMALIDMLDMISKNLAGCLIYHMNGQNYDGACGRCSKYNGSCYSCIASWLNEEHKN